MKTLKILFVLSILAAPGLTKAQNLINWISTYAEAEQISQETGKPIAILFSGSDWCKPCIKLKKYIIETETFADYASSFVMYNADFPYRVKQTKELKEQNEKLAEKYNPNGVFPKFIIVSTEGVVLYATGYSDATPEVYIQDLKQHLASK